MSLHLNGIVGLIDSHCRNGVATSRLFTRHIFLFSGRQRIKAKHSNHIVPPLLINTRVDDWIECHVERVSEVTDVSEYKVELIGYTVTVCVFEVDANDSIG